MTTTCYNYSSDDFEKKYTYGKQLGCICNNGKTSFRLWAPLCECVSVVFYKSGDNSINDEISREKMQRDVNGTWIYSCDKSMDGIYYLYEVTINNESTLACDPYAKAVGVNGERAMIIDLTTTDPENWNNDKSPLVNTYADAVIYELHVRDFTIDKSINAEYPGKFLSVCETGLVNSSGEKAGLDYLKDLGITHIHFLPLSDYATVNEAEDGGYNWGYDPKNYNVPEGSYSTDPFDGKVRIKEMKEMIYKLHQNGVGVIMDVVYNHTYDSNFCFNKIVPGYFYRINADGSYSDGSGCGNDTATERSMVRKFIVDSVKYWAVEYHIDGFRFDLMGLIDIDTMNEIREEINKINPDIILYGEGWDLNTDVTKEGVKLAKQSNINLLNGIAMFNDDLRDALKGNIFFDDSNGYISNNMKEKENIIRGIAANPTWTNDPLKVVNFTSCHDNNTLFDKIEMSNPDITFKKIVEQNKLAALIEFTSQGMILMHAGEEILRTKKDVKGNYVEDSVRAGDFVNSIKWDSLHIKEYRDTFEYYKGLISLRKQHECFRMKSADLISKCLKFIEHSNNNVVMFKINGELCGDRSKEIIVAYNPCDSSEELKLSDETWTVCADKSGVYPDGKCSIRGSYTVEPVSGFIAIR